MLSVILQISFCFVGKGAMAEVSTIVNIVKEYVKNPDE